MQSDARRFNSSSAVLATGSLLADRYLIEFILGQGGQGAVYFALDLDRNDEPVALKEMLVPRVDPRIQRQAIEQFRQEALFLHRLDHPNLAKVYDFFEEKERYYLVMDYIKGKSLGELLKTQNQPFQVIRVLHWAIQLAGVLAYLHSQDPPILFRDVKPGNILVSPHGHIHLIDFGIARVLTPNTQTITYLRGSGSVDYCPLEQTAGGTDQRSDIYSLGATLFHLLTLKTPPRATELASKNKAVPSPRLWNSGIPAPLEDLIVKMMAVRREDRCNSMTYVHGVLLQVKQLIEKRMALPRGTAFSRSKKKTGPVQQSRPWVAVATLTSIVLALLVWLIWNLAPNSQLWGNH